MLVDFSTTWATAPREAPLPGYVCVVAKRHVVEPFELSGGERAAFWDEVLAIAERVLAATGARKMNYEIHGNTVPHLHVHLYPRYPGDPFEGRPIDPWAGRPFVRSDDALEALRATIAADRP